MANAITYNWSIFCETEGGYQIVANQKHRPTTCPNDAEHTITSSLSKYEIKMATPVISDPTRRTGFYTAKGAHFTCTGSTTTTYDLVFPYDVVLIDGYFILEDNNKDDILNVVVAPDLLVGALAAAGATGDTCITLSPTAVDNLTKSCHITLGTDDYQITREDVMNSKVYITPALVSSYPPGTYVIRNAYIVKNLLLPGKGQLSLGRNNPFPTYIPAGYNFRLFYTNNTADDKVFNFYIEHY